MQPLSTQLLDIQWGYYFTLTFGSNWNEDRTRNKLERVYSFLRKVSAHHRQSKKLDDWRWVLCEETGEAGGRFHLHGLLADLGKPTRGHCFAMAHLWRVELKGGWAVIRVFNPALGGVDYVLKCVGAKDLRAIARRRQQELDKQTETLRTDDEVLQSLSGTTLSGRWNVSDANAYEVGKIGKGEGSHGESTATLSFELLNCLTGRKDSRGRNLQRRGIRDKYKPWNR